MLLKFPAKTASFVSVLLQMNKGINEWRTQRSMIENREAGSTRCECVPSPRVPASLVLVFRLPVMSDSL